MNQLEEFELNEFEEQQKEILKPFEITDLNSLNWAFRKLKAYKSKEQEITELAQAERSRIDFWERQQKEGIHDSLEFFETLINQYHAKMLLENPKTKTISTPYGVSKARASKAQPEKADEEAILNYVTENGMDEYIKPTLKWGDLKKKLKLVDVDGEKIIVDENGQVVPGVIVKPETITFKTEVD